MHIAVLVNVVAFGLVLAWLARRARAGGTLTIPTLLQSFVPSNVFADLAGTRPTSVIGMVTFAALLGAAALALREENPEAGERVQRGVDTLQALVLRLVRIVIHLTPYGVLALMTRVVAASSVRDIVQLGTFVVASYAGLAAILVVHAAIVALAGLSPVRFYQRIWPTLTFAFTSRSSAASIPMSVETQVSRLGVAPVVANFAASFGATIGQNACAGLYPAMLAVMIAPSAGVDPSSWSFIGSVVAVAALGSFGIAGVGGGATFAALVSSVHAAGEVAADTVRPARRRESRSGRSALFMEPPPCRAACLQELTRSGFRVCRAGRRVQPGGPRACRDPPVTFRGTTPGGVCVLRSDTQYCGKWSMLKKLGFVGALLTCPCHAGLVLLLLGGTAAGAWLTAHMGLALGVLTAAFVFFLWLAMRPERAAADGAACETCAPDAPDTASRSVAARIAERPARPGRAAPLTWRARQLTRCR